MTSGVQDAPGTAWEAFLPTEIVFPWSFVSTQTTEILHPRRVPKHRMSVSGILVVHEQIEQCQYVSIVKVSYRSYRSASFRFDI